MKYSKCIASAVCAGALAFAISAPSFAEPPPAFHVSTIQAYAEHLNSLYGAMRAVTTPKQAVEFGEKFKLMLPKMEVATKRLNAALANAVTAKVRTPEMMAAEAAWNEAVAKGPAMDAEMERLEKLNPGLKVLFAKFRAMHDD